MDRPFWGVDDPGMPLPFDLADIINRVESLLWRCDISPARAPFARTSREAFGRSQVVEPVVQELI